MAACVLMIIAAITEDHAARVTEAVPTNLIHPLGRLFFAWYPLSKVEKFIVVSRALITFCNIYLKFIFENGYFFSNILSK